MHKSQGLRMAAMTIAVVISTLALYFLVLDKTTTEPYVFDETQSRLLLITLLLPFVCSFWILRDQLTLWTGTLIGWLFATSAIIYWVTWIGADLIGWAMTTTLSVATMAVIVAVIAGMLFGLLWQFGVWNFKRIFRSNT